MCQCGPDLVMLGALVGVRMHVLVLRVGRRVTGDEQQRTIRGEVAGHGT